MSMREKEVLNMQLVLIPILADAWKKTYSELSDIFKKYDVLSYIDVCYEKEEWNLKFHFWVSECRFCRNSFFMQSMLQLF